MTLARFEKSRYSMQKVRKRRTGYVLLVVLSVLTIGIVVLQAIANRSFDAVEEARDRQIALQRRWGRASIEKVILKRADALLDAASIARGMDPKYASLPTLTGGVVLGSQKFDLILSDENSKLNLNWLYHRSGKPIVSQSLTQLGGPLIHQSTALMPSVDSLGLGSPGSAPSTSDGSKTNGSGESDVLQMPVVEPLAFGSFGQVFDLERLTAMTGDVRSLAAMTNEITLYSDGSVNIRRTNDEVLLAVMSELITDALAKRVLDGLRQRPQPIMDLLLEKEVKNVEDRRKLASVLRVYSSNYSLWIEASSQTTRNQYFSYFGVDPNGVPRRFGFTLK